MSKEVSFKTKWFMFPFHQRFGSSCVLNTCNKSFVKNHIISFLLKVKRLIIIECRQSPSFDSNIYTNSTKCFRSYKIYNQLLNTTIYRVIKESEEGLSCTNLLKTGRPGVFNQNIKPQLLRIPYQSKAKLPEIILDLNKKNTA